MDKSPKALVCKYANICDWNCEKCQYLLKELKIVDLNGNDEEGKKSPFPE